MKTLFPSWFSGFASSITALKGLSPDSFFGALDACKNDDITLRTGVRINDFGELGKTAISLILGWGGQKTELIESIELELRHL
jgi:hypothetical protein